MFHKMRFFGQVINFNTKKKIKTPHLQQINTKNPFYKYIIG